MKKKTFILIISFMLAAILASGGMYVKEMQKSRKYRQIIENNYAGAFDELISCLNEMSTNLIKISYVSTPKQMATYASEIYSQAQLAKGALYKLPTGESELSSVYKFLSQAGNYTLAVSKDAISGKDVTDKQRDELKGLSSAAKTIIEAIEQSDLDYNNPKYCASEIEGKIKNALNEKNLGSALSELDGNSSRADEKKAAKAGSMLSGALDGACRLLKNKSLVVVVSDFRTTGYQKSMARLASKHDVLAIRVSDPADTALPQIGSFSFEDPETRAIRTFPTGSSSFRHTWKQTENERRERWTKLCRRCGAKTLVISTDDDPTKKLKEFFASKENFL